MTNDIPFKRESIAKLRFQCVYKAIYGKGFVFLNNIAILDLDCIIEFIATYGRFQVFLVEISGIEPLTS